MELSSKRLTYLYLILIEYSADAGYNWHTVADNVDANIGSYSWTIPNTISEHYRIRISDKDILINCLNFKN